MIAPPVCPAHPPLTSLRSFAPPYAEAKGAYVFPLRQFLSFQRATPVIPSGARNLSPFAERKGVRGMHVVGAVREPPLPGMTGEEEQQKSH